MYPDNELSAGQLVFMAVIVTVSLAAWLTLVLLADRQPRSRPAATGTGAGTGHDNEATVSPSGSRPSGKESVITWGCDDRPDSQAQDGRGIRLAG